MADVDVEPELEPSSRERMNRARGLQAGTLRWAWATLTSMRTALLLLLLLGVAAIPGSLLPQRPSDPFGAETWLGEHPVAGPWLDRLGFFDVFGSPWFAAIYLLLFISLIGCILPRCKAYWKALRAEPGTVPSRFTRFPDNLAGSVDADPQAVLDAAEAHLHASRFRVRREALALSAERGYSREAGNLVFHLALVSMLVGLAFGALFGYRGSAIVVEGQAFSNTLTQYDEFSAGAAFTPAQLPAFTVALDSFEVEFELGPVQRGAARLFRAHVTVSRPGQAPESQLLEVNSPLSIGGANVHLLGHGYAPVVTVRDGNGDIAYSGPVVFLPADGNFLSNGVIKAPDARPERLAFEGIFLPSAVIDDQGMRSAFPDALNPQLLVNVWAGEPKQETGAPENIYVLDQTGLTQLLRTDGQPVRAGLEIGSTYELPDGRGSISFDGLRRWTKLQVSSTPTGWWVLGSVLAAIAGIAVSLLVRPRRLFVRVRPPLAEPVEAPASTSAEPVEAPASTSAEPVEAPASTSAEPVEAPASTSAEPVEAPAGTLAEPVEATVAVEVAGFDRVDGRPGLSETVTALAAACGLDATLAQPESAVGSAEASDDSGEDL